MLVSRTRLRLCKAGSSSDQEIRNRYSLAGLLCVTLTHRARDPRYLTRCVTRSTVEHLPIRIVTSTLGNTHANKGKRPRRVGEAPGTKQVGTKKISTFVLADFRDFIAAMSLINAQKSIDGRKILVKVNQVISLIKRPRSNENPRTMIGWQISYQFLIRAPLPGPWAPTTMLYTAPLSIQL